MSDRTYVYGRKGQKETGIMLEENASIGQTTDAPPVENPVEVSAHAEESADREALLAEETAKAEERQKEAQKAESPNVVKEGEQPEESKEVKKLLAKFERAVVSAATATIEIGQYGSEYITARLAQSELCKRAACTETLLSKLQEHSDSVVKLARLDEMLSLYGCWTVFGGGEKYGISSGASLRYISAFRRLIHRDEKSRAEVWKLLPEYEGKAHELWTEGIAQKLSGKNAVMAVQGLVTETAGRLCEEARAIATANPDNQHAQAALRKREQELDVESRKLAQLEGKKAESSADPVTEETETPAVVVTPPECEQPSGSLIKTAQSGCTARDFGEQLADGAWEHPEPVEVLKAFLTAFSDEENCEGYVKRAIAAALLVINRGPTPRAPVVNGAPTNGELATVA